MFIVLSAATNDKYKFFFEHYLALQPRQPRFENYPTKKIWSNISGEGHSIYGEYVCWALVEMVVLNGLPQPHEQSMYYTLHFTVNNYRHRELQTFLKHHCDQKPTFSGKNFQSLNYTGLIVLYILAWVKGGSCTFRQVLPCTLLCLKWLFSLTYLI